MKVAFLLAALAALAAANIIQFNATIQYENDPSNTGKRSGTVMYYYDTLSATRYRYLDINSGVKHESQQFVTEKEYSRYTCSQGSCASDIYTAPVERWFKADGDVATGKTNGNGCTEYSRGAGDSVGITFVYIDASGHICQAKYANNMLITFGAVKDISITTDVFHGLNATWRCPPSTCKGLIDLVLVLDESGSITDPDWAAATNFTISLVNSFDISKTGFNLGIVLFSTVARELVPMSNDAQSILDTYTSTRPVKDQTCIGCGLRYAVKEFTTARATAPRPPNSPTPLRISIFATDGANNEPESGPLADLQAASALLFETVNLSIAVGTGDFQRQDLELFASDNVTNNVTNGKLIYSVTSWEDLKSLFESLIKLSCPHAPDTNWNGLPAAIAGGIIAGIIVAAVIGAIIFFSVSAYSAYKMGLLEKLSKSMVAMNNPLHKGNERESTNPMYAGGAAP